MPRKRRPLASPTSIRRLWPARIVSTAPSGSPGISSTLARSLPRPPGMTPSGVSSPAIAPPTAPSRPSPLITTGSSPASIASSACSAPCSRPLVRWTRNSTRRASSAASTRGSSFSVLPPAEEGLTRRVRGIPAISIFCSLNGVAGRARAGQAEDREAALSGGRGLDRGEAGPRAAALFEPAPQAPKRALAAGLHPQQAAARSQHPRRLLRVGGGIYGYDQGEEVLGEGEVAGRSGLEGDPPLRVEPDP